MEIVYFLLVLFPLVCIVILLFDDLKNRTSDRDFVIKHMAELNSKRTTPTLSQEEKDTINFQKLVTQHDFANIYLHFIFLINEDKADWIPYMNVYRISITAAFSKSELFEKIHFYFPDRDSTTVFNDLLDYGYLCADPYKKEIFNIDRRVHTFSDDFDHWYRERHPNCDEERMERQRQDFDKIKKKNDI